MKQPEALRLADELAVFATWRDDSTGMLGKSATELRRLHEANQALILAAEDAVARIKSQLLLLRCDDEFIAHETQKLRAAIDIAKGEQA